ncbi:hypothetical protein LLEC1_04567 [Akanthomyces lecanii]|uniref:Fido domain-containing protein n=1 Tax=Cordyceps confragosa TaxID=2714763 RepID=A0A179ID02_CORDF|nr:hypothetical protein LLEC1_04567 [Akanthomyces lecanii]
MRKLSSQMDSSESSNKMMAHLSHWPFMSGKIVHIEKSDTYRVYADDQSPELLFSKACSYLAKAQDAFRPSDEASRVLLQRELEQMMMHAIFGSNRIEGAGLGFPATEVLCQRVLRGADDSDAGGRRLDDIFAADPSLRGQPVNSTTIRQREVVQHTRAYLHMIHKFVVEREPMTEELIRSTHEILCRDIPIIDREGHETPSKAYAGIYRTVVVAAGSTNFVVPTSVPLKMAQLCRSLQQDLAQVGASNAVDPFALAAKYSLEFVQIHPFLDGNGRLCRMLLNAVLFRFVGIFAVVGEDDADTDEYMGIKKRSSETMEGHGEYATFVLGKSVKSFRRLKQKLHGKSR